MELIYTIRACDANFQLVWSGSPDSFDFVRCNGGATDKHEMSPLALAKAQPEQTRHTPRHCDTSDRSRQRKQQCSQQWQQHSSGEEPSVSAACTRDCKAGKSFTSKPRACCRSTVHHPLLRHAISGATSAGPMIRGTQSSLTQLQCAAGSSHSCVSRPQTRCCSRLQCLTKSV